MPGSEPAPRRPAIENLWQKRLTFGGFLLWMPLAPLAILYELGISVRNGMWRIARRRPKVKVVSVGNLTVGGNGKTPFTIFLARRIAERGMRVAIVSRGFGGKRKARAVIVRDGAGRMLPSGEAGDEPAMMARALEVPIAVAKRRINGIELLRKTADPEIVILDDGFQHVRLYRDVDIVLVNRERGFGNGWVMPAGPMRERLGAISRAHAVVLVSSSPADAPSGLTRSQMKKLLRVPILSASLRSRALVRIEMGRWVEYPVGLAGRRVLALSGLANPSGFYAMLREVEADLVGVLEYPDHHHYTSADWHAIVKSAREADLIVTTEKDLVKLERFPFARDSLYALRLEVTMNFEDTLRLDEIVFGKAAGEWLAAEA